MPSNIQENLPVAFAMLEKLPDKWRCHFSIGLTEPASEGIVDLCHYIVCMGKNKSGSCLVKWFIFTES